jgi:hypothetical protein
MARAEGSPRKACCLVSEILEEAGLDRERVRRARRQVLEGIVLLCQWQLSRMDGETKPPDHRKKARKVAVD